MSVDLGGVAVLECAQVLAGPHVVHHERTRAEARDVGEVKGLGRSGVRVDDEDMCSLRRLAGVELRRRCGGGALGGRERGCGFADMCVLVECEQLGVLDDSELGGVQLGELWDRCERKARHCPRISCGLRRCPEEWGFSRIPRLRSASAALGSSDRRFRFPSCPYSSVSMSRTTTLE